MAMHALIVLSAIAIALETDAEGAGGAARLAVPLRGARRRDLRGRIRSAPAHVATAAALCALSFWGIIDLIVVSARGRPAHAAVARCVRCALRLVRLLKLFRSSRALDRLVMAMREVRGELFIFGVIAALMLYVSAVGIYLFEHEAQPEVFSSILDQPVVGGGELHHRGLRRHGADHPRRADVHRAGSVHRPRHHRGAGGRS